MTLLGLCDELILAIVRFVPCLGALGCVSRRLHTLLWLDTVCLPRDGMRTAGLLRHMAGRTRRLVLTLAGPRTAHGLSSLMQRMPLERLWVVNEWHGDQHSPEPILGCTLPGCSLRTLQVTNCTSPIAQWLACILPSLTQLTALHISGSALDRSLAQAMGSMRSNVVDMSLSLYNHPWVYSRTPVHLPPGELLSVLPLSLTTLVLNVFTCAPLHPVDVEPLSRLTALRRLEMYFTPAMDTLGPLAATLTSLRALHDCRLLWRVPVSNPLVAVLSLVPWMRRLELNRSDLFFPNRLVRWGGCAEPRMWVRADAQMSPLLVPHYRSIALVNDGTAGPVRIDWPALFRSLEGSVETLFLAAAPHTDDQSLVPLVEAISPHLDLTRMRDLVLNVCPGCNPYARFPDLQMAWCLRRLSLRLSPRSFQHLADPGLGTLVAQAPVLECLELVHTPMIGHVPSTGPPNLREIWWTGDAVFLCADVLVWWGMGLRRVDALLSRVGRVHLIQLAWGLHHTPALWELALHLTTREDAVDQLGLDVVFSAVAQCVTLVDVAVVITFDVPYTLARRLCVGLETLRMLKFVHIELHLMADEVTTLDVLVGPLVRCHRLERVVLRWHVGPQTDVTALGDFVHAKSLQVLDVIITGGSDSSVLRQVADRLRKRLPLMSYSLVADGVQYGWPVR